MERSPLGLVDLRDWLIQSSSSNKIMHNIYFLSDSGLDLRLNLLEYVALEATAEPEFLD